MKLNRSKNAKKGITYGFINKLITLILPFITRTMIIEKLGMDYAGIKGLFGSILTVLNLSELGVGAAIVYSMYKPIAEDDNESLCALMNLYRKLYRIIGTVILALGLLITPFVKCLIKGSYPDEINIYVIFIMFLLNTVLSYWLFAYKSSVLSAYQRTDIQSNIGTFVSIGTGFIQIVLLIFIPNYYFHLTVSIIFQVVNNLLISYYVNKNYPNIKCQGTVPEEAIKDIKKKIAGLVIGKLGGVTRNTFDSIFMSMFMGLTMAAIYSNYYFVFSTLTGFLMVIYGSLLGGIGNSVVMDDKEKNLDNMHKLDFIYMIIAGWMSICMLCIYQPFMKLWVGEENMFPEYIMILFPIYFYLTKMGDIRCLYSDAAGLYWENRIRVIVEGIANIILNYVLAKKYGAFGILIATIITVVTVGYSWAAVILFKNYYKKGLGTYFMRHFVYMTVTFIAAVLTYMICVKMPDNMGGYLLRGILCCIVPPTVYLVAYFRTNIGKSAYVWLMGIIKR